MRTPDWQTEDGRVRLYCGDCLQIVPTLGKVDAVVTDIPYGEVNRDSGGLRSLDKGVADIETFSASTAADMAFVGESAYVFCGTEQVSDLRSRFVQLGMTTRLCVWEKTNPSPMNGDVMWLSSVECCVFARKGKAWFGEHCASPVWRGPTCRNQQHKTQKPLWLMERIVSASVKANGTTLDFCMGSGTTGVAAIRLSRQFIGIEKEPEYFESAVERIKAELERAPLFEQKPKYVTRDMFKDSTP